MVYRIAGFRITIMMIESKKRLYYIFSLCFWGGFLTNLLAIPSCKGFYLSQLLVPLPPPSSSISSSSTSEDTLTSTNAKRSSSTSSWKPKIASLEERGNLRNRGQEREKTEMIGSLCFHHVEFYCGDARSMANHFALSLGLTVTGTTGQVTGNDKCVSYGLESGDQFRLLLTAPYSQAMATREEEDEDDDDDKNIEEYDAPEPLPNFNAEEAHTFFQRHGLAARAIGLEVIDAKAAFETSVANGAIPVLEPSFLATCSAQLKSRGEVSRTINSKGKEESTPGCYIAEVELYGDVVLRYVSFTSDETNAKCDSSNSTTAQPFLPHLAPVEVEDSSPNKRDYGIYRIDHAVGNVHNLQDAYSRIQKFTGFHEFAEFTSEDVGTVDSGLNSVVLASESEEVLLPLNEPTEGRRKSQIQTFLEQNEGPGLQHLALKTKDIFSTVRKMRENQRGLLGFELMKRPSDEYYEKLPNRLGEQLTPAQYSELEELGILADSDEEGILFQLFTRPVGDRPTFFFEIIQRIGCVVSQDGNSELSAERPGCGGFGQGNFQELFKSIEDHEKTLKV